MPLSLVTAVMYVYGRLPIVISTIGIALLYESITPLIFGGSGVNLTATTSLSAFSRGMITDCYTTAFFLLPSCGRIRQY